MEADQKPIIGRAVVDSGGGARKITCADGHIDEDGLCISCGAEAVCPSTMLGPDGRLTDGAPQFSYSFTRDELSDLSSICRHFHKTGLGGEPSTAELADKLETWTIRMQHEQTVAVADLTALVDWLKPKGFAGSVIDTPSEIGIQVRTARGQGFGVSYQRDSQFPIPMSRVIHSVKLWARWMSATSGIDDESRKEIGERLVTSMEVFPPNHVGDKYLVRLVVDDMFVAVITTEKPTHNPSDVTGVPLRDVISSMPW